MTHDLTNDYRRWEAEHACPECGDDPCVCPPELREPACCECSETTICAACAPGYEAWFRTLAASEAHQ